MAILILVLCVILLFTAKTLGKRELPGGERTGNILAHARAFLKPVTLAAGLHALLALLLLLLDPKATTYSGMRAMLALLSEGPAAFLSGPVSAAIFALILAALFALPLLKIRIPKGLYGFMIVVGALGLFIPAHRGLLGDLRESMAKVETNMAALKARADGLINRELFFAILRKRSAAASSLVDRAARLRAIQLQINTLRRRAGLPPESMEPDAEKIASNAKTIDWPFLEDLSLNKLKEMDVQIYRAEKLQERRIRLFLSNKTSGNWTSELLALFLEAGSLEDLRLLARLNPVFVPMHAMATRDMTAGVSRARDKASDKLTRRLFEEPDKDLVDYYQETARDALAELEVSPPDRKDLIRAEKLMRRLLSRNESRRAKTKAEIRARRDEAARRFRRAWFSIKPPARPGVDTKAEHAKLFRQAKAAVARSGDPIKQTRYYKVLLKATQSGASEDYYRKFGAVYNRIQKGIPDKPAEKVAAAGGVIRSMRAARANRNKFQRFRARVKVPGGKLKLPKIRFKIPR